MSIKWISRRRWHLFLLQHPSAFTPSSLHSPDLCFFQQKVKAVLAMGVHFLMTATAPRLLLRFRWRLSPWKGEARRVEGTPISRRGDFCMKVDPGDTRRRAEAQIPWLCRALLRPLLTEDWTCPAAALTGFRRTRSAAGCWVSASIETQRRGERRSRGWCLRKDFFVRTVANILSAPGTWRDIRGFTQGRNRTSVMSAESGSIRNAAWRSTPRFTIDVSKTQTV